MDVTSIVLHEERDKDLVNQIFQYLSNAAGSEQQKLSDMVVSVNSKLRTFSNEAEKSCLTLIKKSNDADIFKKWESANKS